jgi:uncharacterized membrane protein YeaQ/YmgE (transglycosylase-associated protein family)
MKTCPTCSRTFDDSFTFCLIDGAILSAPFDSQATLVIPKARNTNPPPTELLASTAAAKDPNVPPTVASPLLQPTQSFIAPQFAPPPKDPVSGDRVKPNENPVGRILLGLGVGTTLGFLISMYHREQQGTIVLSVFFGLVGSVIGRFSSSLVEMIKSRPGK